MSTNFSYTFQAMSSGAGLPLPLPVVKGASLVKPQAYLAACVKPVVFMPVASVGVAVSAGKSFTPLPSPPPEKQKVLDGFDALAEKISDTTSRFWLALDVLEPMVANFQGVLSVKNGLLLSALVPIVNLPLHQGNRQFLSDTPWGRITEFVLTTATWLPLAYSGSKEILATTVETYQQVQATTGSKPTAKSHALSKGLLETALQLMALVIGPYALMHLSDFLISESFYRSQALFKLEGKTFAEIMGVVKSQVGFVQEHDFIEKHGLELKGFESIQAMPEFIQEGRPKLSGEEGLATKALFRRYKRGEMKASSFLPELGITLVKRIPIMVKETWRQIPKVLRNEMPERIDSTYVLSQLGEVFVKEASEKDLANLNKFERVKAYLATQEFKLGGYKTLSSLALLTIWYLCLDPIINKLANALFAPLMVQYTNRQLVKKGLPPYYPPNTNALFSANARKK